MPPQPARVVTFWACTSPYISVVSVNGSHFVNFLCETLVNEIRSPLNSPFGNVNLYDAFEKAQNEICKRTIPCNYNGQKINTLQRPQLLGSELDKEVNLHLVPDTPQDRCQKIYYYDNNLEEGSEKCTMFTIFVDFNQRLLRNCYKMKLRDEHENVRNLGLDLHFRQPASQ